MRNLLALAVAALVVVGFAIRFYSLPCYDSALFEYVGRAISDGRMLYRDIWDNKMPGVFYINALWNVLFGQNYTAHAIAEAVIDLFSVALLARLLAFEGATCWGPPAALVGILLAILGFANYTEHYALPIILIAVLCARERRYFASGVALALAALFWLPSLITIVAILVARAHRRFDAVMGSTITGIVAVLTALVAFGIPACEELLMSWTSYVGSGESLQSRFADIAGVAAPLGFVFVFGGIGLWSSWRGRRSERGKFALVWLIVAFAGAMLALRPFVHYFLPTLPASIYAVIAGPVRIDFRRGAAACVLALALVVFYVLRSHRDGADSEAVRVSHVSAAMRVLAPDARIALDAYEPGIYLATGAPLRDRFELAYYANARFVAARKQTTIRDMVEGYTRNADALVAMYDPHRLLEHAGKLIEVCPQVVAPWHLYVRPQLAPKFTRCPGR